MTSFPAGGARARIRNFAVLVAMAAFASVACGQRIANSPTLARVDSPTLGPADAKVQIVEFLDPACETCAEFLPIVKSLLNEYKGKVRLTVRHLAFHKNSDYAVRALEAARKQNKYWESLQALFASQSTWAVNHVVQPAKVLPALDGVGLDMARLQRDMASPEVGAAIAQDLADAKALKVTQTPEYFVNGKGMPQFGEAELRALVRQQVKAAYP